MTTQHDAHIANWLKANFDLNSIAYDGIATAGKPGNYETSDTLFGAALEYAACYDGALFDKLVAIELGSSPMDQLAELLGA